MKIFISSRKYRWRGFFCPAFLLAGGRLQAWGETGGHAALP